MTRLLAAAGATCFLMLAGCSDDRSASPRPEDPSPTATSRPTQSAGATGGGSAAPTPSGVDPQRSAPPCDTVSDAELTEWTGSVQYVTGPEQEGISTVCATMIAEDDLSLEWRFQALEDLDLEAALEEQDFVSDAEPVEVTLGTDTRAYVLTGEFSGIPMVKAYSEIEGELLEVVAVYLGTGEGEPLTESELEEVVVEIASAYAA